MRPYSLIFGLLIGGLVGFVLTNHFQPKPEQPLQKMSSHPTGWIWPDSLDAVTAAPGSHKIIFENEKIRILEVTIEPRGFEPMHTHRYPSVSFRSDYDTSSYDIKYYACGYDSTKQMYFVRDSVQQHSGRQNAKQNEGNYMKPEGPHRIKNLSNVSIHFFRIELKNGEAAE